MIRDVWFWLPFHMLQAYPMVRNLPLPDFIVPFAHLVWVVMYLAEHWTGLAEPVEAAFAFSQTIGMPFQGICALSFFICTFLKSEKRLLVVVGFILYFGFMTQSKKFGLIGSPKKGYEEQIAASADHKWNDHHTILHVWYVTILWVVALTVPYEQLAAAPGAGLPSFLIIGLITGATVFVTNTLSGHKSQTKQS